MSFFDYQTHQWTKGQENWHLPYNNALLALKEFLGDKGSQISLSDWIQLLDTEITNARDGEATLLAKEQAQDALFLIEHDASGGHLAGAAVAANWKASGDTPTYIAANSFSVTGDKAASYVVGRRLRLTLTGGPVYGSVRSAVFSSVTTITLNESVLDNTLSQVDQSIVTPDATGSLPIGLVDSFGQSIIPYIKQLIAENGRQILELQIAQTLAAGGFWDGFLNDSKTDTASTVSTGFASSGQKDIVVDGASGFSEGDNVDILDSNDAAKQESNVIDAIAGSTFTMLNNLAGTYAAGTAVKRSGAIRDQGKIKLPIGEVGDGRDGSVTITAGKNINTDVLGSSRSTNPDGIIALVTANPTSNSVTVDDITGFADGDKAILINLQGGSSDAADVGNYHVLTVNGAPTGNTINVSETITKSFDGTVFANQKVVLQRIPQWTDVDINSGGDLTCKTWNGTSGGVLVFFANGTVTVTTGRSIHADGKGYRGGVNSGFLHGQPGEGREGQGPASNNSTPSVGANDTGGGGGTTDNLGGAGGGGAGTVWVVAETMTFAASNLLTAIKGDGAGTGPAADGSDGRIRMEYGAIDGQAHPNATEHNDAANPDPGSTQVASDTQHTAVRWRSVKQSHPQRDIGSIDAWMKRKVTISVSPASGGSATDTTISLNTSDGAKFATGDSIDILHATGKYMKNADGTHYRPTVTVSGDTLTVSPAVPEAYTTTAKVERVDAIARASMVAKDAEESMQAMTIERILVDGAEVEDEVSLEVTTAAQDVVFEIGLSTVDSTQQENVYVSQFTAQLNEAA